MNSRMLCFAALAAVTVVLLAAGFTAAAAVCLVAMALLICWHRLPDWLASRRPPYSISLDSLEQFQLRDSREWYIRQPDGTFGAPVTPAEAEYDDLGLPEVPDDRTPPMPSVKPAREVCPFSAGRYGHRYSAFTAPGGEYRVCLDCGQETPHKRPVNPPERK